MNIEDEEESKKSIKDKTQKISEDLIRKQLMCRMVGSTVKVIHLFVEGHFHMISPRIHPSIKSSPSPLEQNIVKTFKFLNTWKGQANCLGS
jgi:hypothetical protein